jgi:hypothetical protein
MSGPANHQEKFMNSLLNPGTLGTLIPIIALLIPIVAIISGTVRSHRAEQERHQTIRELARSGQPIPPELLQTQDEHSHQVKFDSATPRRSRIKPSLRTGIILIALGVGLCACLYIVAPDSPAWGVGLIPGLLGVAFLVIAALEGNDRPDPSAPK